MLSLLSTVSAIAMMKALVFAPVMVSAPTQYQVSRSLRFRLSNSGALNRTWGTPTTQNIWTFSCWVKRGKLGIFAGLFCASTGASPAYDGFRFNSDDTLGLFQAGGGTINLATSNVYRDPTAWYHVMVAYDATQATAANRVVFYVNGVQQAITGTYPVQNPSSTTYNFNRSGAVHAIGSHVINAVNSSYHDGLMAEVYFCDGQALPPSYFGQADAATGVWIPKQVLGVVNLQAQGCYLNFADNSGVTSTTIGKDTSGNGNNWTPTGISVSTYTPNDSLVDSPTVYGSDTGAGAEVRGNYCVVNPIATAGGVQTYDNANMFFTTSASVVSGCIGTMAVSSGKWYFECIPNSVTGFLEIGVFRNGGVTGFSTNGWGQDPLGYVYVNNTGNKGNNNSFVAYGATYTTNDVIGVALDLDGGTLTFYKNGVSQGTAYSSLPAGDYFPCFSDANTTNTSSAAVNFGQQPWGSAAPSGYKAWCGTNLADSAVMRSSDYMDIGLYTGVAANVSVTGKLGPDVVWLKRRDTTGNHGIEDTTRGAAARIITNQAVAEDSGGFSSFNSDGFTVANGNPEYNVVGGTYIGWMWKKGAIPGLDVVTYTGTGVARTIAHGLGAVPAFMIVKSRSGAFNWPVYHKNVGAGSYTLFNTTAAPAADTTVWNNTAPTSSVFSVGTNNAVNQNGTTYVAYLFAEVAGFSRFSGYNGNASTDGPVQWCGFRPRFVMFKRVDATTGNWPIYDIGRNTANPITLDLFPNLNNGDTTGTTIDMLSMGFKLRHAFADSNPAAGVVFVAFAESPFKYARAW